MAEKLGNEGARKARSRELPPRAAKGASKPKAETKRLKPAVPKASGKAAPAPGGATEEAQLREALQLQLIGLRGKHRDIDNKLDVIKGELKELNAQKKEIRNAIKTAGMPLKIFDEAYTDAGTSRVDLERKEKLRHLVREAYGLASGPQEDLLEKLPDAAKPDVYWESEGYKDGIAGKDAKAPTDCPPENHQAYLRGYQNAMKRNAEGIKKLEAKPEAAPSEDERGEDDEGLRTASAAGQPVPPPTGNKKLDDWAAAPSEGAQAEPMAETAEVMGLNGDGKAGGEFEEASADELEAQRTRGAVREKRESQLLN